MNETEVKNIAKQTRKKATSTVVRINTEAVKSLKKLLDQANKKQHGKRIKSSHLVAKAISLITDEHIKELQQESLTNQDRLEIQHAEYCKQNGHISKDEFLGMLAKLLDQKKSTRTVADFTAESHTDGQSDEKSAS